MCDEYSTPSSQDLQNVQEILCEETVNDEDEDIVISEKSARAINWKVNLLLLERNSSLQENLLQLSATEERRLRLFFV